MKEKGLPSHRQRKMVHFQQTVKELHMQQELRVFSMNACPMLAVNLEHLQEHKLISKACP